MDRPKPITADDEEKPEDPPDPDHEVTLDAFGGQLPPRLESPVLDLETEVTESDHETARRFVNTGKFRVELIGTIARFAALGYSDRAICGKLAINRGTLRDWRVNHPELESVWSIIEDLRIYALESKALDPSIRTSSATIVLRRLAQLSPEDWGKNEPEGDIGQITPQQIAQIIERVARESLATMQGAKAFPVRAARLIEFDNESGSRTVQELPVSAEGMVIDAIANPQPARPTEPED